LLGSRNMSLFWGLRSTRRCLEGCLDKQGEMNLDNRQRSGAPKLEFKNRGLLILNETIIELPIHVPYMYRSIIDLIL